MNADKFYNYLVGIVQPNTPDVLSWTSESDYPTEVVKLPDVEVFGWVPKTYTFSDKESKQQGFVKPWITIHGQTHNDERNRFDDLCELFEEEEIALMSRVFRRVMEDDKPAEITLFLLVRFCETWVGLRCKTIET